jgi:alkylation response protein AidB-like acyl-CoA dehydrogenase
MTCFLLSAARQFDTVGIRERGQQSDAGSAVGHGSREACVMTAQISAFSVDDVVAQLEPVLREYAPIAERERQLAPEAMAALVDAGLFRVWTPRAYGGLEVDTLTGINLFEGIARIDSAAGWLVANQTGISTFGAFFAPEGAAEMFTDPRTLCAGAWFPPGTAERVDGGYQVSGRWSFGSGCHYATWLTAQALVTENGVPRLGPDGNPTPLIVFIRADEAEVLDGTWKTLGMRGTGSYDFRASDVFVPDRRAWAIRPFGPLPEAYSGEVYRMGVWTVGPVNGAVALGIAQSAIDDFIHLAAEKTPSYTQTGLADRSIVQERVARAQAYVDAARSYLHAAIQAAAEYVRTEPRVDMAHGMRMALAGSFTMEATGIAVDLIHALAGASAIRDEQPFQQHFRDVHTVSQHAFSSMSRYESVGKLMLGRESDWAFYYL